MANAADFFVKRLDDATIIRIFKTAELAGQELIEKYAGSDTFSGSGHTVNLTFNSLLPWEFNEEDLTDAKSSQYVLGRIELNFSAHTKKQNQTSTDTVGFQLSRSGLDNLTDKFSITLHSPNGSMRGEGEQLVQRAIHKSLSLVLQPVAPEDGGLIPTLTNLSQAFDTTYQRISSELSAALNSVSEERAKQITEFQEEWRRLREEMSQERDELLRTARESVKAERSELENERQLLEDEWSKLEISSHKDARRKQFNQLQASLQESLMAPAVDGGLRAMRWAVFVALLFAGSAAGFFAYLSFDVAAWEATIPSSAIDRFETTLMLILRTVTLTGVSLGAFFGAAAWMRYFYNRDLQAQEEMRRFRHDMARASWVMEAALEIRKEHDEIIPPEWIAGVTEGLFVSGKEGLDEGTQALAALLGLSAGVKMGPNGLEIDLGRKLRNAIKFSSNKD